MRLLAALVLVFVGAAPAPADVVDPRSDALPLLGDLADALDGAGVDVLHSHASPVGRRGPSYGDDPRLAPLLGFRAWPGIEVDLERHGAWLRALADGARGAIAAVNTEGPGVRLDGDAFRDVWRGAADGQRIVITFDAADLEVAERVAGVLERSGYAVHLAIADPDQAKLDPDALGRMFVAADHVLTIDTASARLNAIIQYEAELLAELRRQDEWVASNDAGLPPVKRGSMDVIESLGALPMQVLPGGIVLGVKPRLDPALAGAVFAHRGSKYGVAVGERRYLLEEVSDGTREAILRFVAQPGSHSVVDIAGGRVTLVEALAETRIGSRMIEADAEPFDHLTVNGAQKSLIVDHGVVLRPKGDGAVAADVTLEVRYYRRDADGNADRLATVRFTVQDATGRARLLDAAWSRAAGTRAAFDGSGLETMMDHLRSLALDAALIAAARLEPPADG